MNSQPGPETSILTRETASTALARLIAGAILRGELPPGEPLREQPLAERFGISRTPIREALRLLQNEGLVEFVPNRGATVKSYTAEELEEVFDLRADLEGYAARTAARRITPAQVEALRASCDRYGGIREKLEDVAELSEENESFHAIILEAAASPRLSVVIRQVAALPLVYVSFLMVSPESRRDSEEQHREITAALAEHDEARARRSTEAHVLWARDQALAHLDQSTAGAERTTSHSP